MLSQLYPLRLTANAGPGDTILFVENWDELPGGHFVGLIDRGTHSEEKVLAERGGASSLRVLPGGRGYDGTRAFAHLAVDQYAMRQALATSVGQMVGMGLIRDPFRLERMEKLALAPVSEWIAEGEERAVREWESELV